MLSTSYVMLGKYLIALDLRWDSDACSHRVLVGLIGTKYAKCSVQYLTIDILNTWQLPSLFSLWICFQHEPLLFPHEAPVQLGLEPGLYPLIQWGVSLSHNTELIPDRIHLPKQSLLSGKHLL